MEYKIYCLLNDDKKKDKSILWVKVIADCIAEALINAKKKFLEKFKPESINIFMYETVNK